MFRVYMIFRNQLFADSVGAVLGTHPEIELVGATDNPDQVAADVSSLAPDVVLLEETAGGPAINDAHSILSGHAPGRLITLRLDANGMHVWSRTWRQIARPQDLVEAIVAVGEIKS